MNPAGYQIEARLGAGGFGEVYQAIASSGERVAIKRLLNVEPQALARFERERRLLGLLGREQGFVGLLDAGETAEGPYIVMDFMSGGTLRDRLGSGGPLAVDEVIELGLALAGAMGRAHDRGVIHRDLKPENILFDGEGRVHIGDLGISKALKVDSSRGGEVSLTGHGDVVGTVAYMAPEQMQSSRDADARADVYALGVVLYECLAGQPPFAGANTVEIIFRASRGQYPALAERRPETPPALAELIDACLSAAPDDRPEDGTELAHRLDGLEDAEGSGGLVIGGLIAAACVLLAVLTVVAMRQGPDSTPRRNQGGPVAASPGGDALESMGADPEARTTLDQPQPEEPKTPDFQIPDPTPSEAPPDGPRTLERWQAHFARAPLQVKRIVCGEGGRDLSMISAMALHPRDGRIVTATLSGWIRCWSPKDGACRWVFYPEFDRVFGLAWSDDGEVIAISSGLSSRLPGGLVFLRAKDRTVLARCPDGPTRARLYPLSNGRILAISAAGISIWRARDGRRLSSFGGGDLQFLSAGVAIGAGEWMISGRGGKLLHVRIDTGEVLKRIDTGESACYSLCRIDRNRIVGTTAHGRLMVVNLDPPAVTQSLLALDQSEAKRVPSHKVLRCAAVSPAGDVLLTAGDDERVRRWRVRDLKELEPLPIRADAAWFHCLAFADRDTVLLGGNSGRLRAFRLSSNEELWEPMGPRGQVDKLAISAPRPAGATGRLMVLRDDEGLRSFNAETGEFLGLRPLRDSVLKLACGDRNGLAAALVLVDRPGKRRTRDTTAVMIWEADGRARVRAAVVPFPALGVDIAWLDEETLLMLDVRGMLHRIHASVSEDAEKPASMLDTGVRRPVGLLLETEIGGPPESVEVISSDSSSASLSLAGQILGRRPPWLPSSLRIDKVVRCAGRVFAAGVRGKDGGTDGGTDGGKETVIVRRDPQPRELWRGSGQLVDLVASRTLVVAVIKGQGLIVVGAKDRGRVVKIPLPEGHYAVSAAARADDDRIWIGTARGLILTLAPRGSD